MQPLNGRTEPQFYGPCARCEEHWTRKISKTESGICRYCLAALKTQLERSG